MKVSIAGNYSRQYWKPPEIYKRHTNKQLQRRLKTALARLHKPSKNFTTILTRHLCIHKVPSLSTNLYDGGGGGGYNKKVRKWG